MHRSKKKGDVAYKINLEKAYDNVEWDFLRGCLLDFGFPTSTVTLIMFYVSSSSLCFGMVRNSPPLLPPGVLGREILSPLIYLFFAWRKSPSRCSQAKFMADRSLISTNVQVLM